MPSRLVKRIQDGEFIDMAELTIDKLSMSCPDEASKLNYSKGRSVTSIVEWAQCFTNYNVVRGQAQSERIPDLLGYGHLILEAHLEYTGDGWAVYDRRFCQIAASRPDTTWTRRDNDLWNMVFTGNQRRPYCQHCFGLSHSSEQCCGAPDTSRRETITATSRRRIPRICRQWNYSQCSFPDCQCTHACLTCYNDPQSGEAIINGSTAKEMLTGVAGHKCHPCWGHHTSIHTED